MKKIIACIGTFFALVALSTQAKNPYLLQTADRSAMEHWVDSVFESLSPKERIAQLLVITVRNSDTPQNRKTLQRLIQEQKIGGLLFDSGTAKDQANLTNYCQSLSKVPLMITLDGEWGLAMRLSDTPRFPVNMMLGAVQNDSLLYEYGRAVGKQCRRMGIHVNFAPVLDINSNPRNPVIGKRSFGESLGEFYQFNLSSCIRQQNSLTAQFVSFSLSNLANIFYPPPIFTIINLCLL